MKVVHIIPCDGIGGVEIAAKRILDRETKELHIELFYIADRAASNFRQQLWNPLVFFKATKMILAKELDVILVSLWRSVIVALMIKLYRPKIKFVYFIHSTKTRHFLDTLFTHLAIRFSDFIFGDSKNTIETVVPNKFKNKSKVISFVLTNHPQISISRPKPAFVFWGRLNVNKNLTRSIKIFASIKQKYADSTFTIIGPDDGDLFSLKTLTEKLGVADNVIFTGGMALEDIKAHVEKSSFYLQTSDFEGMAMAVVEAMQMGLVPVVTKVGEISEYCKDGTNAIIVNRDEKVRNRVDVLLSDDKEFEKVRLAAINTWRNKLLYNDSLISNLLLICETDS